MIRAGLTQTQSKLLAFIGEFISAKGYSPSYIEMRDALGMTSIGAVTGLLSGLEERGYVRRLRHRHRSVTLTHPPTMHPSVQPDELASETP